MSGTVRLSAKKCGKLIIEITLLVVLSLWEGYSFIENFQLTRKEQIYGILENRKEEGL